MNARAILLTGLLVCRAGTTHAQAPGDGGAAPRFPASDSVAADRTRVAQAPVPPAAPRITPPAVRYGKWGAAALFAGAMAAGVLQHRAADDRYDDLRGYCTGGGECTIGEDGRYTDPGAEDLYQEVVTADRAARACFVVGEVAFAGAVALFILQLKYERGPRNIPLSSIIIAPGHQTTRFGLRLPIRGP